MSSISRLHPKCEECRYVDDCDEKRKVACGLLEIKESLAMPAAGSISQSLAQDLLVKHNYRDIKVSGTQSITIDLEELKRNLERERYRALGLSGFQFDA